MSKCNNCDQPISGMFGPLCAMCKHGVTQNHQQQSLIADLRQQVERWTQMHYDEMQRHTETSVKLSTAEAQLAAEREAVRVLANEVRWHRRCDAENDTYSDDYSGGMRSAYEDSNANPIAVAAVRNKESE